MLVENLPNNLLNYNHFLSAPLESINSTIDIFFKTDISIENTYNNTEK